MSTSNLQQEQEDKVSNQLVWRTWFDALEQSMLKFTEMLDKLLH